MELVPILRLAWRQRIALAVGALLAVAVGLAVARSAAETPDPWSATARLVVDTPASQVVYAAPREADGLGWRSKVLATLALSDSARASVAEATGIDEAELTIVDPALSTPLAPATLPRRAAEVADTVAATAPYRVELLADGLLPVVTLVASGPDRATTTRLADAARDAAAAPVPPRDERRGVPNVVVEPVGPVAVERVEAGRASAARPPLIASLFFAAWCVAVLGAAALFRSRSGRPPAPAAAAGRRRGLAGRGPAA